MGIESIQVNLSGGSGNADVALSTGGVRSTTDILYQSSALSIAIPGVIVYNAGGNTAGVGTLNYAFNGKTLTWTPPGDTVPGAAVPILTNGRYVIRGSGSTNGYLLVDVVSASTSSVSNYSSAVTIANILSAFLPGVSKDTAYAGATEYFLYYIYNAGAATVKNVSFRLLTDTPGVDTLSVSRISAKNTTELQAAASGHTYSAVGVDETMGDLLTTDYWGFWIKRVTPALTIDGVTSNTFKLRITALT